MSRPTSPSRYPTWLLRRADQAAVAALVLGGVALSAVWWLSQGGWRGRLIELESSPPQTARFQVDINVAPWPELVQLPGVGPTLAERIVETRESGGPFVDHNDLRRRVRGIGPKTFEKIRPYLRPMPDGGNLAGP
jgi:competence protein ComEA